MENPNQMQPMEAGESIHLDCAPPCNGAVCIPRTRYDELLRAESALAILRRAYQTINSFSMDHIMDMVFDSALKYKPEPIPKPVPMSKTETTSAGSASDAK